jgi:hypothetical protein
LTHRSGLRRQCGTGEREESERGVNNICCGFHVFISISLSISGNRGAKFPKSFFVVRASRSPTGYPAERGSGGALWGRRLTDLARARCCLPAGTVSIRNLAGALCVLGTAPGPPYGWQRSRCLYPSRAHAGAVRDQKIHENRGGGGREPHSRLWTISRQSKTASHAVSDAVLVRYYSMSPDYNHVVRNKGTPTLTGFEPVLPP